MMTIKRSRPVNGMESKSFVLFGNTTGDTEQWKWFERAGYPSVEAAQRYAEKRGWPVEVEQEASHA